MKQFLIATTAIFLTITTFGQSSKVTGFRDLVWGVHLDSVYSNGVKVKFKKDKDANEPNTYNVNDDNLTLGAAKLTKIGYHFNSDDRFKKVLMYGDDKYLKDIKDILAFKFGVSKNITNPTPELKISNWQEGDVSISLTQYKLDEQWILSIESNWDKSMEFRTNMNVKDIVFDGQEVKGFRSLKWLQHKDSIYVNGEKLTFIRDTEASQPNSYYLENDKSSFGSVRVSTTNYIFNEADKLKGVVLNCNKSGYDDMKFILSHKLGAAEDVDVFGVDMSVMNWKFDNTTIKLQDPGSGESFSLIIENTKDKTERYIKNTKVTDF